MISSRFFFAFACVLLCLKAQAEEHVCISELNKLVSFELSKASKLEERDGELRLKLRLSAQNRITIGIAQSIQSVKRKTPKRCATLGADLEQELLEFASRRLNLLFNQGMLNELHVEANNLLAPAETALDRAALEDRVLSKIIPLYLVQVRLALMNDLKRTPWEYYSEIYFEIEPWSEKWTALMGRDAPAGVHFAERKIALRPLAHDLNEVKIFLFHELSHLADPALGQNLNGGELDPAAQFANESFAWRQTAAYIDQLVSKKTPVPDLFLSVRKGIELQGLENWVRNVFESNHRELKL